MPTTGWDRNGGLGEGGGGGGRPRRRLRCRMRGFLSPRETCRGGRLGGGRAPRGPRRGPERGGGRGVLGGGGRGGPGGDGLRRGDRLLQLRWWRQGGHRPLGWRLGRPDVGLLGRRRRGVRGGGPCRLERIRRYGP